MYNSEKDVNQCDTQQGSTCVQPSTDMDGLGIGRKPFRDCGIEEKLARMCLELKDAKREINNLSRVANNHATKINTLLIHTHSSGGECVVSATKLPHNYLEGGGGLVSPIGSSLLD